MKAKPRRYWTNTGNRCDNMNVKFTIDTDFITLAIYERLREGEDGYEFMSFKLTQKNVEKEIRDNLYWYGYRWIENYKEGRRDKYNGAINERMWDFAEKKAKELFPKWFINYNNKAHRFITEDK